MARSATARVRSVVTDGEPKVVVKSVDELRPHPKNPRTHPPEQVDGLGDAFKEFGMLQFPVIDEHGTILAGEGRWLAAKKKGPHELPCIVVSGWTEEKKLAFVVSDNRWAMLGGFNDSKLQAALRELQAIDYDLEVVGYDLEAQEEIFGTAEREPRGSVLELIDVTIGDPKFIVEHGDHFILGNRHHLFCNNVISEWSIWSKALKDDALFCPYPGVFVPFSEKAKSRALVMVQEDSYIAGHIIDRWIEVHGKKSVKRGS